MTYDDLIYTKTFKSHKVSSMVMGKSEIQNSEIIIKINEYTIIIVVTLIVHSRSGAAV